jgi:hypothetical protein
MIWNATIYCTLVVLDMIMVSLRCTLVYKPRGMAKMEGSQHPRAIWNDQGAESLR